jgi:signal peptidase I
MWSPAAQSVVAGFAAVRRRALLGPSMKVRIVALALASVALVGCGRMVGGGGAEAAEDSLEVEGSSMEPTLHCARPAAGCRARLQDRVLVRVEAEIERREIVAFEVGGKARQQCGAGGLFVKRVVALAGERVSFRDGAVYVDGRRLVEPYASGPTDPVGSAEVSVPARHVFVLGDNRAQSCDSRVWGPLSVRRVVGVGVAIERAGRRIPLP